MMSIAQEICRDCFNVISAKQMGIELTPFKSGIYEYPGGNGKMYKFTVAKIVLPMGIGYEATEITNDNSPGYKVAILDDLDCDQDYLFYKLEAKIKYTLSEKYLQTNTYPNGIKHTRLKEDEVVGRFEYNETNDEIHNVVIDGKVFSWEQLGEMLNAYEGFQFKLKIYDITEDIR
ncbi:MAG: hypothetical protein RQM92_04760 [Candidatus Syntrophopropionicum ammoniitolerans]